MNVLRHRPTARFDVIAPAGFRILAALDRATLECGVDLTITSGTDGHAITDPHANGEAFDVSVKGLTPEQIIEVRDVLLQLLGPLFTVLFEVPQPPTDAKLAELAYVNPEATGQHFHIQKRRGTTYPPPDAKEA